MKKIRHLADFGYFFIFLFAGCDFFVGIFLYSPYNAITHAYANNAETAVINPGISPSEKYPKNTIATIRIIVYPMFFFNTVNSLSNIFSSFVLVWLCTLYQIFLFIAPLKNTAINQRCYKGRYEQTFL